jgi:hypothetical protein
MDVTNSLPQPRNELNAVDASALAEDAATGSLMAPVSLPAREGEMRRGVCRHHLYKLVFQFTTL